MHASIRLCLAGASLSNANRGVQALGVAFLQSLARLAPDGSVSVFDDDWGVREDGDRSYGALAVQRVGVRVSRRLHRPESWSQVSVAQTIWPRLNPVARRIAAADAVVDVSGGDSFTDLYGPHRFRQVLAPKLAARRAGCPLVLLPQTYGPFHHPQTRVQAAEVVRASRLAYSRDEESHQLLVELAGDGADPGAMRRGVDLAFALESRPPRSDVVDRVLALEAGGSPLVGVNVSGLLGSPRTSRELGLVGGYLPTMRTLVEALVRRGVAVLLVSHVYDPVGGPESDLLAIEGLLDGVDERLRNHVFVVPPELHATEMKWVIGRCSWFVGSRMHSTVAALSSLVPAAGYAYSGKTRGVFATAGAADQVIDARSSTGPAAVEAMLALFEERELTSSRLREVVPEVIDRARGQVTEIVDELSRSNLSRRPVSRT